MNNNKNIMNSLKAYLESNSDSNDSIPMKNLSAEKIADYLYQWFLAYFPDNNSNPQQFYCGITNSVSTRMSAHKSQDHNGEEIEFKIAIECKNEKVAEDVEDIMRKRNFDTGNTTVKGNGAADDSRFVYLYKKPK